MLFWLLCALLTVAVTVVTLRPLIASGATSTSEPADNDDPDIRVYKDQLAEVERDIARGLLSEEEAKAARIEISRRILAAAPNEIAVAQSNPHQPATQDASAFRSTVFYLVAAAVATSSVGLYLLNGSPGYSTQPFAERANKPAKGAPVQELVARVEARLREAPNDGKGWDVLGPVYLKQQRFGDAIRAFGRAIELLGENRKRLRGLAEAHLAASNGVVGEEVRIAYRKILAKEPDLIAPRFWLAVGLEQDGNKAGAKAAYEALLAAKGGTGLTQLPPALRQLIRERLAVVTGKQPPPRPAATDNLPEAGKGAAPPPGMAAGMSSKERAAMIEQMVSGLAQRLNENGGTEQEWQRLIRAYMVLGRREQAAASLVKAKKQFAADEAVGSKLDQFARSLGLNPD